MSGDYTSIVFTSTQTETPSEYSSYLSLGPSGAVLNCQPSPTGQWVLTLWWYATTNGCPNGYSFSEQGTSQTCIYTSQIPGVITQTWQCDFTVSASTTSTVDGGTTTLQNGAAATLTGSPETATVTQTVQVTSLQVSIYDPGAVTVVVTSTITLQHGSPKRRNDIASTPSVRIPVEDWTPYNESGVVLAELFKRQNAFTCPGTSYTCSDGSACLGDSNPFVCCDNTLICVPYDWTAPFVSIAINDPFFDTTTAWSTYYFTTYETANAPSSTVTVIESVTETIILTNVNQITTVATASDATVTSVYWVTSTLAPLVQTLTQDGTTLTLVNQTPLTQLSSGSSSSATSTLGAATTSSTNDVGMKVGIGVGVPIAVALFGLLFFLIFRSRGRRNYQGDDTARMGPAAGGSPQRPMSNLPQYTPMMEAGAPAAPIAELKPTELPEHTHDEVTTLVDAEPGQRGQQYVNRYELNEAGENGVERRYELPSPVHEMHELPGYYGA